MGLDFIRGKCRSFTKSWDNHLKDLYTPEFFKFQPVFANRSALANICVGETLKSGEYLVVQKDGETLTATRGIDKVAQFINPSPEIIHAVEQGCGVAVGKVDQINSISRTVEISLH